MKTKGTHPLAGADLEPVPTDQTRPRVRRANVTGFYALQAGNYLLPLLSIPLLVRALGPHGYGVMSLAFGLAGLAVLVTDAGFTTAATRFIARMSRRPARRARLVSAFLLVRSIVGLLSATAACLASLLFPDLRGHVEVMLFAALTVVGTVVFPQTWLASTEQGEVLAISGLFGRSVTLCLMLLLVRSPDDLALASLLQASALLVSAAFFYVVFGRTRHPVLPWPGRREVTAILLGSRHLWPMEFARQAGAQMALPLLAVFEDAATVGVYGIFEKLARAGASAFLPLIGAMGPYWIRAYMQDEHYHRALARWILVMAGLLVGIVVLGVLLHPIWQPLIAPSAPDTRLLVVLLSAWTIGHVLCDALLFWRILPVGQQAEVISRSWPIWALQPVFVALGAYLGSMHGVAAAVGLSELLLMLVWMRLVRSDPARAVGTVRQADAAGR